MPYPCWPPAYPKCNWSPLTTCSISEFRPSVQNPSSSPVDFWVGVTRPVATSHFSRLNPVVWGLHCAFVCAWGPFWTGSKSCHVAHYADTWWGYYFFTLMHVILRTRHHIHSSVGAVLEVQCHIIVIWHWTSRTAPTLLWIWCRVLNITCIRVKK